MKVTFYILAAVLAVVDPTTQAAVLQDRINLSPSAKPQAPFSPRFNYFDVELLRYTAEQVKGNFMVSPASVKSALAMLLEGAHGSCADELRKTLRLPEDPIAIRNQLHAFLGSLQVQTPGVVVESANRIFLTNKLTAKPEYQQLLKNTYFSEVLPVDFSKPQATTNYINNWVRTTTHGLIPTLVEPANFETNTVLLMANALYFKGIWENSFNKQATMNRCFKVAGGCLNTPMMENQVEFNYGNIEELKSQAIELPYQGGKYSMLILLPNENSGISTLIKDLPFMSIPQIVAEMEMTDVHLTMPRFTIDFTEDLIPILQKVGIREVFGSAANLSGIVGVIEHSPQVNNVMHRTRIEVNEEGSVAAAATGAMIVPLIGSTTARMVMDHPFLFFIRDVRSGAILFEGRVDRPEEIPVQNEQNPVKGNEEEYAGIFQSTNQNNGQQANTQTQNTRPRIPPSAPAYQPSVQVPQPLTAGQGSRPAIQEYQYNPQSQPTGTADRVLTDSTYYAHAPSDQQVRRRPSQQANRYYAPKPTQQNNPQYGKQFPTHTPVAQFISSPQSQSLPSITLTADQNQPSVQVYPYPALKLKPESFMVMEPVYYESESYSNHLRVDSNDGYDLQKEQTPISSGSVPGRQETPTYQTTANRMDGKFQQPYPKDHDGIRFTL